jgi:23S rRNA (cytosine1962-C5)-methyltransferase
MARTFLTVNGYSERWLRQGFPWVYPDEVLQGRGAPGQEVVLRSQGGSVLGTAIADDGWIAARRFRPDDGPIDGECLGKKLETALRLRRIVVPPDTTVWRWVHGENDGLPGVRIDVYDGYLVLSLDSGSLLPLVDPLIEQATQQMEVRGVYLGWRPDPREKREFRAPKAAGCLWGAAPDPLVVEERGVRVRVFPGAGKDIGIFPDMRENRRFLEPHWAGRRVLNLFAHTGLFSVCARRHGASEVVSVDLSPRYLELARENYALNELPVDTADFLAEDSFKVLDRFRRQKRLFDIVIADPPGHSHGDGGAWSGEKDYGRLVGACLQVLAPGGWLVACSNLGSISPKTFQGFLEEGARRVGRRLLLIHEGTAAPDFPAALDFPESRYLKCWICVAE